jgi:hypothetical protein
MDMVHAGSQVLVLESLLSTKKQELDLVSERLPASAGGSNTGFVTPPMFPVWEEVAAKVAAVEIESSKSSWLGCCLRVPGLRPEPYIGFCFCLRCETRLELGSDALGILRFTTTRVNEIAVPKVVSWTRRVPCTYTGTCLVPSMHHCDWHCLPAFKLQVAADMLIGSCELRPTAFTAPSLQHRNN